MILDGLAYFISDAHIGARIPPYNNREAQLLTFLRTVAVQARHLFIVGDLFDFWIEYRHAIRPDYFNLLYQLRSLVLQGISVHYIAGNHDFALGSFLRDTIGLSIYQDRVDLTLQGKSVHLFHGDGLLKADVGYRILRRILRNPTNQSIYRLLHPSIGVPLASFFSGSSRALLSLHISKQRVMEYREHARRYLESGKDVVVFGHIHYPEILSLNGKIYCNTGEWIRRYTFAQMQNGNMTLWEYIPRAHPQQMLLSDWN